MNEEMISSHLYTAHVPDPDLLIRTSGEMRISNFLLWQIAYAELYVTETLWPDFTQSDLLRAVLDYQRRDRRFGGVKVDRAAANDGVSRGCCSAHAMSRVLTALVLIPFALYAIFWAPHWVFVIIVAMMAIACYHEFVGIAAASGVAGPVWIGFGLGGLFLAEPNTVRLFPIIVLTFALRLADLTKVLGFSAATILGVLYIFGAWRCAIDLRAISPYWILFALAINWVGDIAAFYVGRTFGKHKLSPRVSPGKSWEGAIGSIVAAVAVRRGDAEAVRARHQHSGGCRALRPVQHRRAIWRSCRVRAQARRRTERQRDAASRSRRLSRPP